MLNGMNKMLIETMYTRELFVVDFKIVFRVIISDLFSDYASTSKTENIAREQYWAVRLILFAVTSSS